MKPGAGDSRPAEEILLHPVAQLVQLGEGNYTQHFLQGGLSPLDHGNAILQHGHPPPLGEDKVAKSQVVRMLIDLQQFLSSRYPYLEDWLAPSESCEIAGWASDSMDKVSACWWKVHKSAESRLGRQVLLPALTTDGPHQPLGNNTAQSGGDKARL